MKYQDMSPIDKLKSVKGEAYQGNYLVNAKERNSESKNRSDKFRQQTLAQNRSLREPTSASKAEYYRPSSSLRH